MFCILIINEDKVGLLTKARTDPLDYSWQKDKCLSSVLPFLEEIYFDSHKLLMKYSKWTIDKISSKGQLLLQKCFDQTTMMICKYSHGNKQACKVLRNSHSKWRSCKYIFCDRRTGRRTGWRGGDIAMTVIYADYKCLSLLLKRNRSYLLQ